MNKYLLIVLLLVRSLSFGQLAAGPMAGESDFLQVRLWVETKSPQEVYYRYWPKGDLGSAKTSKTKNTTEDSYFMVQTEITGLEPGTVYNYEVYLDGKKQVFDYELQFQTQTLWQFRTDPPAFKFAVGSCTYTNEAAYDRPGRAYGQSFDIFNSIATHDANFMLWGGDNIYLREVDWNTKNGIYRRYSLFKGQPELQKLWGRMHHFAIWDDHDFGPNDSDRSYFGKSWALEAFKSNWANPNYIFENEAVTGTFMWEDVQFFLLDDRWFKAPNSDPNPEKEYLGKKQLDWLIDHLTFSRAPFKVVVCGGQVINAAGVFENMAAYPKEREELLRRIHEHKIPGVVFISGDRHHTAINKLERENAYPLYDFTISPLTSSAYEPVKEEYEAGTLLENTVVKGKQNFAIMEVTGSRTDRKLNVKTFDAQNTLLWSFEVNAKDLVYHK